MILTPGVIDEVAARIERAFVVRHPGWNRIVANSRVWSVAAVVLVRMHEEDPTVPLDPELFVACQGKSTRSADPWESLTRTSSGRRYRSRIRAIVRSLTRELRDEVKWAERRVRGGLTLESVVHSTRGRLSSLARYIIAIRAGKDDLAGQFRTAAQDQHRACPLYRQACSRLLPSAAYPVLELIPGLPSDLRRNVKPREFSLN